MPKFAQAVDALTQWIIILVLAVVPLFFLPLTQDFYDTNKWMLLFFASLAVFLLWGVRTVASHTLTFTREPAVVGVGAFVLAAIVSVILASPNKVEGLLAPYGLTFGVALAIILFFGHHTIDAKGKQQLRLLWYGTTVLLSLVAIYQFFGVGKTMFPNVQFLANDLWTPVGSTLSLVAILAITLPLSIQDLGNAIKKKEDARMALLFSFVLIVIAGITVTVAKLLPQASQSILSPLDGWAVTLEILKDPKRALFGVGAENFLYAFTTGRPLSLNSTPLWNLRFTTNASILLHMTATLGILGLIATILFAKSVLPKPVVSGETVARGAAILSILLVPPTITLFVSFLVLIFLTEPDHGRPVTIPITPKARWASGVIALAVLMVALAAGFFVGKSYAAEMIFYRSLEALARNDGTGTYNFQIEAATLAPAMSRYHLAYSQTNFAIASAIATQGKTTNSGQPVQLSQEDRKTISSLISQSIREAKIAVNLAPENTIAWENLARLYQNLINIADGADQWSVATYQRAIQLDPTNPALRIGLGGLFLLRQDLDTAQQQFALAVNLKPDWPNGHYNLAYVYRLKKDYLRAASELAQTLSSLPGNSPDRIRVESELAEVKGLLTPAQKAALEGRQPTQEELKAGSELTRPDQQPAPVITPKLELPADASPSTGLPTGTRPAAAQQNQGQTGNQAVPGEAQGAKIERGPEEVNPTVQPTQ